MACLPRLVQSPGARGATSVPPGLHSQLRGAGLCPCKSACVGAVPVPASWQFICLTLSPPRLGVAERKMGLIQPCVPHRLVSSLSSESRFKKNVFH